MSEHRATVSWTRRGDEFRYETYDRNHEWAFEGGVRVPASAAEEFLGDASRVDPEQAFVASLSACHMLTFLAVAARRRHVVDAYEDEAVGYMEKNERGKLAITRVVLRPRISFSGERLPTAEQVRAMHERSHAECFIANSVTTEVLVEGDRGGRC